MKVVVDTNVIVSALLNTHGIPAQILALILGGKLRILYDNRILFEYYDVISREDFCFDTGVVDDLISYFRNEGEYVNAEYI